MNIVLPIAVFFIFFSCRSKEKSNTTVAVSDKSTIAKVDTVRREKFTASIQYDKYSVDILTGKRTTMNYSGNRTVRRFRSAINWSIDKFGLNFAGHYNLARWGCGTSCQKGAITDLKTGRVYDIPAASLDYDFRKDSRLLVVNPPDSTGFYDYCSYCEPELWLWNENNKKFEKLN